MWAGVATRALMTMHLQHGERESFGGRCKGHVGVSDDIHYTVSQNDKAACGHRKG